MIDSVIREFIDLAGNCLFWHNLMFDYAFEACGRKSEDYLNGWEWDTLKISRKVLASCQAVTGELCLIIYTAAKSTPADEDAT